MGTGMYAGGGMLHEKEVRAPVKIVMERFDR
jgi:hypothetical protein